MSTLANLHSPIHKNFVYENYTKARSDAVAESVPSSFQLSIVSISGGLEGKKSIEFINKTEKAISSLKTFKRT